MIFTFDIIQKDIELEYGIKSLDEALIRRGLGRSPISRHKTIWVRSGEGTYSGYEEAEIIGVNENQLHVKYKKTGFMKWIDPAHDISISGY